jgi:Spy/CpxP family protein refolding chaperone
MIKIFAVVVSFTLAAIAGLGLDQETTCSGDKQAAKASCSLEDHAKETTKVQLVKLTEGLQLTSTQAAKVEAILADGKSQCTTLTAKFAPLMEEIHALKHSPNPDVEAIKAKKAELVALKKQYATELSARRATLIKKIKAVLTSEQVAKFEQIQSELFGDELALIASTR